MHAGMRVDEVKQRFRSASWELVDAEPTSIKPTAIRRVDDLFRTLALPTPPHLKLTDVLDAGGGQGALWRSP
jgi:hypothetical protein